MRLICQRFAYWAHAWRQHDRPSGCNVVGMFPWDGSVASMTSDDFPLVLHIKQLVGSGVSTHGGRSSID
jgi:hypothetical protein